MMILTSPTLKYQFYSSLCRIIVKCWLCKSHREPLKTTHCEPNTTPTPPQVRSHYVYGPINMELVFNTTERVKTINSTLSAVAAHAVAQLENNSSKLIDFIIDR